MHREGITLHRVRSMPHISTYGGSYFSAQPEKEDFGSFEPREAKFQEASTNDELTGLKGLNWGEICDVGASLRQSDDFIKLGDIKGDRLFTTGGGGDSITGEGRSTNIWTNGGASTFEDSNKFLDVGSCGIDLKSDADLNDAVFGMRQNIDWTAANGGPGSSYLTAKNASKSNAYVNEDDDSFPGRHGIDRSIKGTHVVCFEDIGSGDQDNNNLLIGVRENITGTAGAGGSTFMTGQFEMPTNNLTGSADPGGDDI